MAKHPPGNACPGVTPFPELSINLLEFDVVAFEVFVEVNWFLYASLEKSIAHSSAAQPWPSTKAVKSFTSKLIYW